MPHDSVTHYCSEKDLREGTETFIQFLYHII